MTRKPSVGSCVGTTDAQTPRARQVCNRHEGICIDVCIFGWRAVLGKGSVIHDSKVSETTQVPRVSRKRRCSVPEHLNLSAHRRTSHCTLSQICMRATVMKWQGKRISICRSISSVQEPFTRSEQWLDDEQTRCQGAARTCVCTERMHSQAYCRALSDKIEAV